MATAEERVAAGVALLDRVGQPDWFEKIDCATLDIASGTLCVCGQLYGSWANGSLILTGVQGGGFQYGFTPGQEGREAVNEIWREAIAKRRLAKVPERELVPA